MKKTTFFVRIFDISPCVFTQIPRGISCWMRNLIPHPTSTHTAYFWQTPLPPKQEIPEKMWWWHQRALPIEIWVKTRRYMSKIQTKKVVFFMIPIPKFILKICLRVSPFFNFKAFWLANTWWHEICIIFGRPILNWNFL